MNTRVLLTIAGTDPSGAAGIQADLQVFRDFGFHGASVITSVLAQNTTGVTDLRALEPDLVRAQLRSVLDDLDVAGVKVGLVSTCPAFHVVAGALDELAPEIPVVWDPVLASGDGARHLTEPDFKRCFSVAALTRISVFTPNIPEAATWLGRPIRTIEDAESVAGALAKAGPRAVLLKVGHLTAEEEHLRDIWADAHGVRRCEPLPRLDADVRGTGCQLSSALCALLADGLEPLAAAERAREYLNDLLRSRSRRIGRGRPVVVRASDSKENG